MSSQVEWVAPAVVELVDVFEERASELKFPELDAKVLGAAVKDVESAVAEVQRLEAELERAREVLASKQDSLLGKSQRALAYARVYAEEDAELSERLGKILLPKNRRPSVKVDSSAVAEPAETPVRRKRMSKPSASEPLFAESDAGAEAAAMG